jgi:N12 class adenine-specific DNA methylase
VLGIQSATSGMYGAGYTVALPDGGRESLIATLVERMRALPPGLLTPAPSSIASTPGSRPRLTDGGGDLMESAPGILDPQLSASQTVRAPALFAVRDAARAALRAQLDGATPQVIQEGQRRLNAVYDQFVFRYGPLNAHANVAAMGINPDAFFLRALERWDTETQQRHKTGRPVTDAAARQRLKMPLFHEIVVRQARPALSARSVRDAYLITLNECGGLNFGRMAALLGPGRGPDNVRDALAEDGLIFDDPEGGWQTADAYLSGNVKRKLATADKAAVAEPRFQRNVEALQVVIPADIPPGQIEVRLGTHWIPPADVNQFLAEVLDAEEPPWSRAGSQFFNYVAQTADWVLETEPVIPAARNFGDWGTPRASALRIVVELLNGRLPKVEDELDNG